MPVKMAQIGWFDPIRISGNDITGMKGRNLIAYTQIGVGHDQRFAVHHQYGAPVLRDKAFAQITVFFMFEVVTIIKLSAGTCPPSP